MCHFPIKQVTEPPCFVVIFSQILLFSKAFSWYNFSAQLWLPPADCIYAYKSNLFISKAFQRFLYPKILQILLISFTNNPDHSRGHEDSFTKLRNDIAHSKRIGIEEYLKIAENIPYQMIQQILLVISDILSGNVTP